MPVSESQVCVPVVAVVEGVPAEHSQIVILALASKVPAGAVTATPVSPSYSVVEPVAGATDAAVPPPAVAEAAPANTPIDNAATTPAAPAIPTLWALVFHRELLTQFLRLVR
jgi:hypothetical protein